MSAFSVCDRTLWCFAIIFQLMLEGYAGRLDYRVKENQKSTVADQISTEVDQTSTEAYQTSTEAIQIPKELKVNILDINNSSKAECKLSSAHSSTSQQICLTPGCTKAAGEILLNINEDVDPCDDFFRFACGGWIDRHTIPENYDTVNVLSVTTDQILPKLKDLMEKKLTGSEPGHVRIIKNMYDSCMDIETIRASGLRPLDDFLVKLGGWPVLEGMRWEGKDLDWIDILALARKRGYGFNYLIKNTAFPSSSGVVITFEMTDRVYKNGMDDPKATANLEKMVEMAVKLGAHPTFARRDMLDVINFEISLGEFDFPENSSSRDLSFYSVKELEKQIPQIDWKKYIRKYLLGHRIPPNSTVSGNAHYLTHFAEIMENTEERVLNNYILWRIADEYANAFLEVKESGRWKYCLGILRSSFGDAVSSYYVKNYFDEKLKERIQDIITIQQRSLLDVLENNDWLDQDTKEQAMEKVNALKSEIGYPDRILNDTEIYNMYKDIGIINGSFIDNYMKLRKWKIIQRNFKEPNPTYGDAVLFEGRHLPGSNSIYLASSLLHKPFFSKYRPNYINFGSVGFQVGHLIQVGIIPSYRFPANYSLVDKNGNLTESEEKRKCFKEQYQNYTLEDGFELKNMNILKEEDDEHLKISKGFFNFESTENLIRNMADSEGLKIAYKAYNTWVAKYGPEAQLPGLKYTPKQLFWISFASNLCEKSRPGYYARLDAHIYSPSEYRVAGSIANQPDFANDFQCQEGSSMNPKTKCQLW